VDQIRLAGGEGSNKVLLGASPAPKVSIGIGSEARGLPTVAGDSGAPEREKVISGDADRRSPTVKV
jgi:hypothetical protein